MNKGLAISGGVLILLSLFSLVFSLVVMDSYEPNSDNILHDTETDGMVFNFDGSSSWLEVYAKGEVDCYSYSISVSDDMFEYFYPNCDAGTEIADYTYLGDLEIYDAGSYNIDAEGNVVIVDADDLIGPLFAFCGGGVCCLLGVILLIVGFVLAAKKEIILEHWQTMLMAVLLLHFGGFFLGFLVPRLIREQKSVCRTLSIEVGMQNSGLGMALASKHFSTMPMVPAPCALSAVMHCIIGSLLAAFWQYEKRVSR